jgi:Mg2+ and Co2+ transporter CorA
MGDKRKMKISGELDYRIRYDVEHDLFHAQNVFNDEYIKPTFIEYVQKLEKEVEKHKWNDIFLEDCADYDKKIAEEYTTLQERIEQLEKRNAELKEQNSKAKEIIKKLKALYFSPIVTKDDVKRQDEILEEAEQFINENSTYERIQKAKYNYAD